MTRAATPAIAALVAAGVEHEVLAYRHDPRSDAYGDEAADDRERAGGVLGRVDVDVGGVVRARALAKRLNTDLAIVDKRRTSATETKQANLIGASLKDKVDKS